MTTGPIFAPWLSMRQAGLVALAGLLLACQAAVDENSPAYRNGLEKQIAAHERLLSSPTDAGFQEVFFMPLHPRSIEKLRQQLQKKQEQLRTGGQRRIEALRVSGPWALAAIRETQKGHCQMAPLWLYYYQRRWRVISPTDYASKEVRGMMNLHQEHKALNRWFLSEAVQGLCQQGGAHD